MFITLHELIVLLVLVCTLVGLVSLVISLYFSFVSQSPEIRKYKRKFSGEILCGALWGVNLLVGTDNGLLLLDRSGHGKGGLH